MRMALTLLGPVIVLGWTVSSSSVEASHLKGITQGRSGGIVLGSKSYYAPQARGWGSVKPRVIYNGGDPAGLVSRINWYGWGGPSAIGWGLTSIFKQNGGYYGKLVRAELRATDIGRCSARGPLAYRRLYAREPSRPGGPLGKWFRWSGTGNVCRAP